MLSRSQRTGDIVGNASQLIFFNDDSKCIDVVNTGSTISKTGLFRAQFRVYIFNHTIENYPHKNPHTDAHDVDATPVVAIS